ncbi:DNA-binding SARP family transcriptional activator [Rhodococcus sp. 27YEA15]
MRYQILGGLNVVSDDSRGNDEQSGEQVTEDVSSLGARKVQTVLAALLIRSNQVVSSDQLLRELWGDSPPRRATAGLHVYISQLRKYLTTVQPGRSPLITRAPGYLIELGNDDLDLLVFRRLVREGRTRMRAGRHEEASASFWSALELIRGPILSDLDEGEIVGRFGTWAEEARRECVELLVECDFILGRHRELIGFLYDLVYEQPLREVFYHQLMLALYRSDRRADALRVYTTARETLTRELGLEPCRALRELHQAILVGDETRLAG